jgi:carboxymethylenebutenolidase
MFSFSLCCAAAPFYGIPQAKLCDVTTLTSKPVQGHYGETDPMKGFSDADSARALGAALKAAGNANAEVFLYPGVGHAFMNDSPAPYESFEARRAAMGFVPYDAGVAALAWERLVGFFKKHLA